MKKIIFLLATMLSVAAASFAQSKNGNSTETAKPYLWGVATSSMAIQAFPNAENFYQVNLIVTGPDGRQYAAQTIVHATNDTLIQSFKKKDAGRDLQAMFTPIDSVYTEVHGPECSFQVLGSARDEGYACLSNWRIVPKGTGLPFGANVNFSKVAYISNGKAQAQKKNTIMLFEFNKCLITGNAQFFDVEEFNNSDAKYAYGECVDATNKRIGFARPLLFLDAADTMYLATQKKPKEAEAYFWALPVSKTMVLSHEMATSFTIKNNRAKGDERKKLIRRLEALKIAVKSNYWLPFGFDIVRVSSPTARVQSTSPAQFSQHNSGSEDVDGDDQ